MIRLLCCALFCLFLLNSCVFYHTFLSFSTPIFLSVALFLFESVFTLLPLFHSSDFSVIFNKSCLQNRVKSNLWHFLSNNPATSQPLKNISQDVRYPTYPSSGQRPRKIRVRSAASFIITALPLARESHVFPGKDF